MTVAFSQPIPLYDCLEAVRTNARVFPLSLQGDEAFQVPAPSRCEYCIRHNKPHRLSGTFEQKGDIVCTMGTCELMADFAKCSRCDKLVSRGGLGEDMILLSWTTACTTIWAHFQDYAAWQATALTTNSTT